MEYINLHTSVLDSAEFKSGEPVDQATWLKLLRFCCGQENGGVIEKAAAFSDRQWQNLACVTLEEVRRECGLWKMEDGDLVVNYYPIDSEKETRAKRKGGRIGNLKRWGKRRVSESHSDKESDSVSVSTTKRNETESNETPPVKEEELKLPESVSDEAVFAYAKEWPGEMASGTPVMESAWVVNFLAKINGRREWPRDWQRYMVSCWRADWRSFNSSSAGGGSEKNAAKKTGEVSATVQAVQNSKRKGELQARLAEVQEETHALYTAGAEVPQELMNEERDLVRKIATLD